MKKYYVNNSAQPNGDHEVHKDECPFLSSIKSKKDLGNHPNCYSAVLRAKIYYPTANGCKTCSNECHTS